MLTCQTCKSPSEWLDSGQCVPCSCKRQKAEAFRRNMGGKRAEDFTVEKFKISEANHEALEACKAFNPAEENLYIFGPVGSGKTHLAVIAARRFPTARLLKPYDITRAVRSCESAAQESDVLSDFAAMPVLVIDDLGVSKDTEFSVNVLYEFFDRRYMEARNGLIVTSNLSLDDMAEKFGDDRITSRLAQVCKVLSLRGEKDHRIGK